MENEQENPIIYRLKQFLASTGLSSTQFADKAGIPRPTLSQLLHGRNKSINNQILSKLDESFPELNTLWLLFGRGSMHVNSNFEISEGSGAAQNGAAAGQSTEIPTANEEEAVEYARMPNKQSACISDLLGQNIRRQSDKPDSAGDSGVWTASVLCSPPDDCANRPGKRITSIIVLYSDNSFETFLPTDR